MLTAFLLIAESFVPQDAGHFQQVGLLSQLLPQGQKPAPVSKGIPFAVTVSEGGSRVSGNELDLQIPGGGKLHLSLASLGYANGHLTAQAKVSNPAEVDVQGVRLDVTSAVETYTAKDASGKDVEKTRAQDVSLASPIFFGDMQKGLEVGPFLFDVSGIKFSTETRQVVVNGVVSGLRFVKTVTADNAAAGGFIDADADGHVYVSDPGGGVTRIDIASGSYELIAKTPDQCVASAFDLKSGRIAARCGNNTKIFFYTKSGDEDGGIPPDNVPNYADELHYDPSGRLWGRFGATVCRFGSDNKADITFEKVGDYDVDTGGRFVPAADGSLYFMVQGALRATHDNGKTGTLLAKPGWRLGQIIQNGAIRLDSSGWLYVAEARDANANECDRVSVFDTQGRFVRTFGRGADKPMSDFPDAYYPFQIYQPSDIAFAPDGTVYVSGSDRAANGVKVTVLEPF